MKQDTEVNIRITENKTNNKGIMLIIQTVDLECINCGIGYELQNSYREKSTDNANLKDILTDYINNNFWCEDCIKGESE